MATKTEKLFWATMGDSDVSARFGPFATPEEAEAETRRLGWRYVLVAARTTDEFGTVLDMKERYYEPTNDLHDAIDSWRGKLVKAKEAIVPMNSDEEKFFEEYEKQLSAETTFACAECGEDIEPSDLHDVPIEHMDGSKETLHFHASFKTCCPLKWANKRLNAAADKLDAIVKMYDEIKREIRDGR
jgi:uncharacterized protein YktA (UPF0223 family)